MKLLVLYREQAGATDALRDHSHQLVEALRRHTGVDAELRLRSGKGRWVSRDADAVLLQYNPFSYGRWGFAPWLVVALLRLRLRRARPRIAVMVHEPYVPMTTWRLILMGIWQRAQLRLVAAAADEVLCSTESFAQELTAKRYSKRVRHVPVASNFPDMRGARAEERERLDVPEDGLVLAMLGTGHPSRLNGHLDLAVNAVTRGCDHVTVLNLGAGAPPLRGLSPDVRVHEPGIQPAEALARQLASADLFLAPFVDGVSTRRGSVMAALQHAIPVVGTDGSLTDGLLRRRSDALCLVPADRPDQLADAAVRLAADPEQRQALGAAGRSLYEQCLDWPIIARAIVAALE